MKGPADSSWPHVVMDETLRRTPRRPSFRGALFRHPHARTLRMAAKGARRTAVFAGVRRIQRTDDRSPGPRGLAGLQPQFGEVSLEILCAWPSRPGPSRLDLNAR